MVIIGTGFAPGLTVTFGGTLATAVVLTGTTQIDCLTPPHALGLVDVKVNNFDGGIATLTNGFRYVPAIYADTPLQQTSSDPTTTVPGTTTTSQTNDLAPGTHLVTTPSIRLIRSLPPPNPELVYGSEGYVTATGAQGPIAGASFIYISGLYFVQGATVTIGGVALVGVTVLNAFTISGYTPPHAVGAVDVVVTNPDFQVGTLPLGFTYINPPPTIVGIFPNAGSTAGGSVIGITGTNFDSNTVLTVGHLPVNSQVVVNSQVITATVPAGPPDSVDVRVDP